MRFYRVLILIIFKKRKSYEEQKRWVNETISFSQSTCCKLFRKRFDSVVVIIIQAVCIITVIIACDWIYVLGSGCLLLLLLLLVFQLLLSLPYKFLLGFQHYYDVLLLVFVIRFFLSFPFFCGNQYYICCSSFHNCNMPAACVSSHSCCVFGQEKANIRNKTKSLKQKSRAQKKNVGQVIVMFCVNAFNN